MQTDNHHVLKGFFRKGMNCAKDGIRISAVRKRRIIKETMKEN